MSESQLWDDVDDYFTTHLSPNDDALAMQKLCKSERDAQSSSWNSNGLPFVAESLAALYDWKVNHTPH